MHFDSVRRSLMLSMALAMLILAVPALSSAEGGDDWRKEFDEVCGKTSESQSLSVGDLEKLVARCEKLKPQIEKLGESERKVYLRRLKMCRDLYVYVLDSKK